MPDIVYIHPTLVNEHGVKPKRVSEEFAKRMVQKGYARVINSPPKSNPTIHMPEHPIREMQPQESLSEEQGLFTFVSWVRDVTLPRDIIDVGEDCGFQIRSVSGGLIDVNHMLLSDLVVVNVGEMDFQYEFKYSLKVALFQRLVPFVVRWYKNGKSEMLTKQLMTRSRLNVFENEELLDSMKNAMGDLIHPYIIYKDPYNFWREISKVC